MDTFFLRIIFAFCCLIAVVLSQTCEESHYQRCAETLMRFTNKDDLIFALSEEEMKYQCVEAQAALGCVTRYVRKCLSLEMRQANSDLISGNEKLVTGFCSEDSDLRYRYIQSLPCYQTENVTQGIRFCQEKFRRNQNDIALVQYEDKIPLLCCSFDGYRRCLKMMMQLHDECQDEPINVIDEIVQRMAGTMGESACDEHFEKCTGGGSNSIAAVLFLTLLSIIASTFFQFHL